MKERGQARVPDHSFTLVSATSSLKGIQGAVKKRLP